jgi:hypothetical protein
MSDLGFTTNHNLSGSLVSRLYWGLAVFRPSPTTPTQPLIHPAYNGQTDILFHCI